MLHAYLIWSLETNNKTFDCLSLSILHCHERLSIRVFTTHVYACSCNDDDRVVVPELKRKGWVFSPFRVFHYLPKSTNPKPFPILYPMPLWTKISSPPFHSTPWCPCSLTHMPERLSKIVVMGSVSKVGNAFQKLFMFAYLIEACDCGWIGTITSRHISWWYLFVFNYLQTLISYYKHFIPTRGDRCSRLF